ncbi:MAG: hypothetical protein ACO2PN_03915, partial [Pyrobaculum sp.]
MLFAGIERTVREALKKAEEAGISDAEYRIKQFVLEVIDILARAGERYRRDALKGVSTVEKALRATALAGLSATALYSVYHGLYSEAVVSSVVSAVALAEVGRFREAVQYVQKAAKALYEAAKEVFEHVKITVQRLVELFVEAVAKVLAWIDEHKAHLFLMAAVAAGVVALSVALNLWGLAELDRLAYAASLTPFIPAGVEKYSREEAFNILKNAPDPYEKFKKIAKAANAGGMRLAEPWESLRGLIMPKRSEEERLMRGWGAESYSKYREDENYRRALFYAMLALEEAFSVYRSALRKYAEGLKDTVQRMEAGEKPFKKVVYAADLKQIKQLAEEGKAFEKALDILRTRLNEYAVGHGLRDLLDVNEEVARRLAEAKHPELSEFNDVSFGTKAYAALIAYREHALGRRGAFGTAAEHWLEVGGSAWLLYYTPITAHQNAEKTKAEKPVAVEEVVAEALRRLLLRPGADHYSRFVELLGSGKLALELKKKTKSSNLFKLYRLEEGDGLVELGIKLRIKKVGEGIVYHLGLEIKRWLGFFKQELEAAEKAAEEVEKRLPVEDRLPYMVGWVRSDVSMSRNREGERVLQMGTSHLWQLAETHALFGWSVVGLFMTLTLKGPKLAVDDETPLERLDKAIRESAEGGWLKMLGIKAESWDDLRQRIKENWGLVVSAAMGRLREVLKEEELRRLLAPEGGDVAKRRKGGQVAPRDRPKDGKNMWEELRSRLNALRDRLNDDKIAREVVAPALLVIQAEKLGVNETTLRYFGAVVSGAIDGDGSVSAAMKRIELASGECEVAQLWAAALATHGIKTKIGKGRGAYRVNAFGDDAVKLARLYFLYGAPLLEGDERIINHKRAEAMELGAEGLNISWEGLRRTRGGAAAVLIISEGDTAVKYNVYLRKNAIVLEFSSADRSHVDLAARLLRLAGVSAEVKRKGDEDIWHVRAATDMLAAGRKELRDALTEIVKKAVENGWVKADKAERWLEKLESGRMLKEGWPNEVMLVGGALVVRSRSTNRNSIEQVAQRLREMGLEEGKHFTVEMPEEGREGYILILRKGLERAVWLSVHGEGDQQRLAADFVEHILKMTKDKGDDVRKKAEEIVKKGMERDSLKLERFEEKVEVNGKTYVVKVIGGEAVEEDRDGRKLLRIKITAEVDGVKNDYEVAFGRHGKDNVTAGYAVARADAPGG